ncbi:MAG TPA: tail fiber domain-containing protein, partial [Candidatus Paceibacterota bacterium]|nr:tail fiber domain-containing protein [Candidatus Paceibacterota bacterium]
LAGYLTSSSASSTYVPYTGATADVNLGAFDLTTTDLNVSGIADFTGSVAINTDPDNNKSGFEYGNGYDPSIAYYYNERFRVNSFLETPHMSLGVASNYLLRSEDFTTTWIRTGGIAAPVSNSVNAPNGALLAENIAAGTSDDASIYQTFANSTTGNWSAGVWMRAQSGTSTVKLRLENGVTVTEGTEKEVTIDTKWRFFSVNHNFSSGSSNKTFRIITGQNAVSLWGARANQGETINAYRYTTTSASVTATSGVFFNNTGVYASTFTGALSGNATSATSSTSSTYSTSGTYGGVTLSNTTGNAGKWELIGTVTLTYNSGYTYGHSWDYEINLKEFNNDNSIISQNDYEDISLKLKGNLASSSTTAIFNSTVPDFSVEVSGDTQLTSSDFAAVVYSTSTSTKVIRYYVKLPTSNSHYSITPINYRGFAYSSALATSTSYVSWTTSSNTAVITTLPTPAQGSVVNGNVLFTTYKGNGIFSGLLSGTALKSAKWYPGADSTTAIQINKADGLTNILNIDTTNSRVGIGTTSPTALLNLAASTGATETAPLKFTSGTLLTTPEAGAMEFDGTNLYFTPSTTRKTIAFAEDISSGYVPYTGATTDVNLGTHTLASGSIDIASGNLDLDNTTYANQYGVITKNGTSFIHNFNYGNNGSVTTQGHNLFIGENAGNFTMGSTAIIGSNSSNNIGIGYSALLANTTGFENSAVGSNTLYSNTIGYGNSAVGSNTLYSNIQGDSNSAVGYWALYSNLWGDDNSALGKTALFFNQTGNFNSALGSSAGSYATSGNNSASSYSVYLGASTKSLNGGGQNEIVIGYNATGAGSNTAVIGNSSLTSVYLGSSTPSARLYAKGITLSAGTATAGTAPLKFTSGTLLAIPEAGAMEFDGTHYYVTIGSTRYQLDQQGGMVYPSAGIAVSTGSAWGTSISGTSSQFVKGDGSLDSNTYLTTSSASSTYVPYTGATTDVNLGTHTLASGSIDIASGNLDLDNTTYANQYGVITKNGTRFIHNFNYGNNGTVTTEGYNLFVGESAGNFTMGSTANTTAKSSNNIGIGYLVLNANTTGNRNIAVGNNVLKSNTTGEVNSALGHNALYTNTSGWGNSAVGGLALYSNTTGFSNSALGYNSLYSNTTGQYNSAVGDSVLKTNTTGTGNSGIGYYALYFSTASGNSAVGYQSLYVNSTGGFNSAVGYNSLGANTTGTKNSALGFNAGQSYTTTDYSVYLGANTQSLADDDQNEIVIGYNATGLGSNTVILGNSSITKTALRGNVGIGTTSPGNKLTVVGDTGDTTVLSISTTSGNTCNFDTTTGSFACASDARLKQDISSIDGNSALSKLVALNPVMYHYNWQNTDEELVSGFIAQEFEEIFPSMVFTDSETGYKSLSYVSLIPYLVKGIQEQQQLIGYFVDDNQVDSIITDTQNEQEKNALDVVQEKIDSGVKFLTDFVSVRVIAIRGYFEEVFSKKIHSEQICLKKSDETEICIDGNQLENIINSIETKAPNYSSSDSVLETETISSPEISSDTTAIPETTTIDDTTNTITDNTVDSSSDTTTNATVTEIETATTPEIINNAEIVPQ